ncbi:DUF1003 domain-containing protein [Anatilimnocola sp. NA78]|uniref:DUF1003 domain-containing protein n=1 Tax=Anatilimnocola sp. NA78 TaxID=3415683 RepID=UPI003CE5C8F2
MRPLISEALRRNIDSIAELEQEFNRQRTTLARLSDRISSIAASPFFFLGHIVWFVGWIVVNTCQCFGISHFDPYPFSFLGLCIAFEATLLSMFILMSQQRQTHQAEQWAHAGLQLGMLNEQETTKMLQMAQSIRFHLGMKRISQDLELEEMVKEMPIVAIMQELERALEPNVAIPTPPMEQERRAA